MSNSTLQSSNSSSGTITSVLTANATPQFTAGPVATVDFALSNLIIGSSPNTVNTTGNTGLGQDVLKNIDMASGNVAIGNFVLQSATNIASDNTSVGFSSQLLNVSSGGNTSIGLASMSNLLSGQGNNTALGNNSLAVITTGGENIAIGVNSGNNYQGSESSNIVIGSFGDFSESNTIRIGTQGAASTQQNRAFVAGIVGNTVSNSQYVAVDSSSGQLGVIPSPVGTAYFFAASAGSANLTGDGTNTIVPFTFIVKQNGSGYTASSFTAPVTGVYSFSASIILTDVTVAHTLGNVFLATSDSLFSAIITEYNPATAMSSANEMTMQVSGIVSLTSGEVANVNVVVSGGTKTIGIKANSFNSFYSYFTMALMA